MTAITHCAGLDVRVDQQLRQRCAWCGAVLIDYDLTRIAVPLGQDPTPGTWTVGGLVTVDGNASWTVEPEDGDGKLPADACARLDHEVTALRSSTLLYTGRHAETTMQMRGRTPGAPALPQGNQLRAVPMPAFPLAMADGIPGTLAGPLLPRPARR